MPATEMLVLRKWRATNGRFVTNGVESSFNQRMRKAVDAYIAAAGIDGEEQPPTPEDDWLPSESARLNLAQANITSELWATGYKLDLSFIDNPVLDEWGYPKHTAGCHRTARPVRGGGFRG